MQEYTIQMKMRQLAEEVILNSVFMVSCSKNKILVKLSILAKIIVLL